MDVAAVALSGGVDSAVAALTALEEGGRRVRGVTMRLGIPGDEASIASARRVASHLGIEHEVIDLSDEFGRCVVDPFADAYAHGLTPNPCAECNATIKFGSLLDRVTRHDDACLYTGHYVRRRRIATGRDLIARGSDPGKEQSYFLYRVRPEAVARSRFPLGGMSKRETRRLAERSGLPVAEREDSQEICFLGETDYRRLVRARHPHAFEPGDIVDEEGRVLGTHRGVAHYTVGQRKGLGIDADEPLYVVALRPERDEVVVAPDRSLEVRAVTADALVWWIEETALECEVQVRYRGESVSARVEVDRERDTMRVELASPLKGVAPGQALVCYRDDAVIGGGRIRA